MSNFIEMAINKICYVVQVSVFVLNLQVSGNSAAILPIPIWSTFKKWSRIM